MKHHKTLTIGKGTHRIGSSLLRVFTKKGKVKIQVTCPKNVHVRRVK